MQRESTETHTNKAKKSQEAVKFVSEVRQLLVCRTTGGNETFRERFIARCLLQQFIFQTKYSYSKTSLVFTLVEQNCRDPGTSIGRACLYCTSLETVWSRSLVPKLALHAWALSKHDLCACCNYFILPLLIWVGMKLFRQMRRSNEMVQGTRFEIWTRVQTIYASYTTTATYTSGKPLKQGYLNRYI